MRENLLENTLLKGNGFLGSPSDCKRKDFTMNALRKFDIDTPVDNDLLSGLGTEMFSSGSAPAGADMLTGCGTSMFSSGSAPRHAGGATGLFSSGSAPRGTAVTAGDGTDLFSSGS